VRLFKCDLFGRHLRGVPEAVVQIEGGPLYLLGERHLLDGLSDTAQVPAEEFAVEEPLTVGELKRQLQADLAIPR